MSVLFFSSVCAPQAVVATGGVVLVKVMAGLSGEEGSNSGAVNLPWGWSWVKYFIFISVASNVAILLQECGVLRR